MAINLKGRKKAVMQQAGAALADLRGEHKPPVHRSYQAHDRENPKIRISAKIPPESKAECDQICIRRDITFSAYVAEAIAAYNKQNKTEESK